jgi:hypothetical protein
MDNYIEHIVKARRNQGAILVRSIGTALAVVGLYMILFIFQIIGFIPLIVGIVMAVLAKSRVNYEYEYEITNGDFSIDKILNKSSRKHIIAFTEDQIKRIMLYDNPKFQNELDRGCTVKNFTSGYNDKHEMWYGIMVDQGKSQFAVIIETDDRTKEYIEQYFKKRLER